MSMAHLCGAASPFLFNAVPWTGQPGMGVAEDEKRISLSFTKRPHSKVSPPRRLWLTFLNILVPYLSLSSWSSTRNPTPPPHAVALLQGTTVSGSISDQPEKERVWIGYIQPSTHLSIRPNVWLTLLANNNPSSKLFLTLIKFHFQFSRIYISLCWKQRSCIKGKWLRS